MKYLFEETNQMGENKYFIKLQKAKKKSKKKKETTLAVKINKILRQYRSDQRNIRNSDCFQTGF